MFIVAQWRSGGNDCGGLLCCPIRLFAREFVKIAASALVEPGNKNGPQRWEPHECWW
jgi:hypothetical protein